MYKNAQFVIKALKYFISCFIENVKNTDFIVKCIRWEEIENNLYSYYLTIFLNYKISLVQKKKQLCYCGYCFILVNKLFPLHLQFLLSYANVYTYIFIIYNVKLLSTSNQIGFRSIILSTTFALNIILHRYCTSIILCHDVVFNQSRTCNGIFLIFDGRLFIAFSGILHLGIYGNSCI